MAKRLEFLKRELSKASWLAVMVTFGSSMTLGQSVTTETPVVKPAPALALPDETLVDAFASTSPVSPPLAPPTFTPPAHLGSLAFGAAASIGATHDSFSSAPAMIGDFFGGSFFSKPSFQEQSGNSSGPSSFNSPGNVGAQAQTISLAGGDRRFKIAENVSPIPRDRVFFNFNHFENALTDFQGNAVSLDRYTCGIEKTFWDHQASIEVRLPFAHGLNSTQDFAASDASGTELSNLSLACKTILWSGPNGAITGGTTFTLPIADDYVESFQGIEQRRIENDAFHLAPYVGWLYVVENRCFAQGFVQTDFDLNGNDVISSLNGFRGTLQDQNLMFVDASMGKWLYRSDSPLQRLTGIAAISELHYTSTMNDTDSVDAIQNYFGHMDVLNMTLAMHADVASSSFRVGAAAPLRDDEESLYDAEIIVQFTRSY